MNKEDKISSLQMKKTTVIIAAFLCLTAGFVSGFLYKKSLNSDRTIRKRTVQQPVSQVSPPLDNRFKQVLALHLKVVDNPKDASAWADLGHTYFDMNEFENAIQAYKKHLELNPNNADVWTDLGIMCRRSGKPEEAIKAFDKAISIAPEHRQSRFNKGIVFLHDLRKPAEALAAWQELLKINPEAKAPTGRSLKELVEQLRRQTGTTNDR